MPFLPVVLMNRKSLQRRSHALRAQIFSSCSYVAVLNVYLSSAGLRDANRRPLLPMTLVPAKTDCFADLYFHEIFVEQIVLKRWRTSILECNWYSLIAHT